jgi:hypothetical protein
VPQEDIADLCHSGDEEAGHRQDAHRQDVAIC